MAVLLVWRYSAYEVFGLAAEPGGQSGDGADTGVPRAAFDSADACEVYAAALAEGLLGQASLGPNAAQVSGEGLEWVHSHGTPPARGLAV